MNISEVSKFMPGEFEDGFDDDFGVEISWAINWELFRRVSWDFVCSFHAFLMGFFPWKPRELKLFKRHENLVIFPLKYSKGFYAICFQSVLLEGFCANARRGNLTEKRGAKFPATKLS